MNTKTIIIIVLIVAGGLAFLYFKFIKRLNLDSLTLVTGGVKCGKTSLSVALATKDYMKRYRNWCFRDKFCKFFHLKNNREMPLFYSNVPVELKVRKKRKWVDLGYSPITEDLIMRRKRFNFGSVVYFCESSLLADSTDVKNVDLNKQINYLVKLSAQELHGGTMWFDTQSLSDNHYGIKRNLARYLYVNKLIKCLPFILLFDVRERMYSYDTGISGVDEEITDTRKFVLVRKSVWKKFDHYAFSGLTDDLEPSNEVVHADGDLKVRNVVTFRGTKK